LYFNTKCKTKCSPSGNAFHLSSGNSSSNTANIFQVDANSGLANALVVQRDGNVGIGTSTPTAKLQVTGNIGLGIGAASNGANKAIVVYLKNGSGVSRVEGDIVIAGGGANSFTTTTAASDGAAIGVLTEACGAGATCKVAIAGIITVNCISASIGGHCITTSVAGRAGSTAAPAAGASIGVFLASSNGTTAQLLLR
jgi:hypothetical protein